MSKVRGRSREDHMPEGRWPRGVTPHLRSGAAAESTRLRRRRNGREELPRVRGQGQRLGGDTPSPKPKARAAGRRSYPTALSPRPGAATRGVTRSRGCAVQEGLEELSHIEGQEGRW